MSGPVVHVYIIYYLNIGRTILRILYTQAMPPGSFELEQTTTGGRMMPWAYYTVVKVLAIRA